MIVSTLRANGFIFAFICFMLTASTFPALHWIQTKIMGFICFIKLLLFSGTLISEMTKHFATITFNFLRAIFRIMSILFTFLTFKVS